MRASLDDIQWSVLWANRCVLKCFWTPVRHCSIFSATDEVNWCSDRLNPLFAWPHDGSDMRQEEPQTVRSFLSSANAIRQRRESAFQDNQLEKIGIVQGAKDWGCTTKWLAKEYEFLVRLGCFLEEISDCSNVKVNYCLIPWMGTITQSISSIVEGNDVCL